MSRGLVNKGNPVVVVPLTSETRRASSYNIALPASEIVKDAGNNSSIVDSVALCSQVFMVDKRKLENKIGKLSYNAVLAVQLGLAYVFDIR
jgi:mRNA-degrading endonuclease toxin of MazEF toxin-antitoxin module